MNSARIVVLAAALLCAAAHAGDAARLGVTAQEGDAAEVELRIRNHLFEPAELVIPAETKVRVRIHNLDATPEEFESWELNREKVILGGESTVLFVGPLAPGEYPFFGEFNPKTAQGKLIAQ